MGKLKNFFFLVFSAVFLTLLLSANGAYAQRPASGVSVEKQKKNKAHVPDNPEREQQKGPSGKEKKGLFGKTKADGEADGEDPRSKKGWFRRFQKQKNKEYEDHHDRIQTKKVRKRMKKNEKRSKKINKHKKPSIFKRLFYKKGR